MSGLFGQSASQIKDAAEKKAEKAATYNKELADMRLKADTELIQKKERLAQEEAQKKRKKGKTILTSPLGLTGDATTAQTLLGGK